MFHHPGAMGDSDLRSRVVLESIRPAVDGGRYPIKRTLHEPVEVSVQMFADGHDRVAGDLCFAGTEHDDPLRVPLRKVTGDLHCAVFVPDALGIQRYWIEAWIDRWATWCDGSAKKAAAGVDIAVELQEGMAMLRDASVRAAPQHRAALDRAAAALKEPGAAHRLELVLGPHIAELMHAASERRHATRSEAHEVWVEPERARFCAWYELFPRSASPDPARPGTLRDVTRRLEYVAELGFDTVYLPPVHPIGRTKRKGPNNALVAAPEDPGSPWAIGSAEGGHLALHPDLGTWEDFRALVERAESLNLHIALDVAFQCSPDHPWVHEHPEWFRHRPDGSIHTAENPPKRYEDIYPLDFESPDAGELWNALLEVFTFWIERGVRSFRVDNPHTKSFRFWAWIIRRIKEMHPDVIFLSEAFARPNVARHLAKSGFTQSYGYFPWKNGRGEIEEYFREITSPEVLDYMRTSSWTNTPDILTEYLQWGGRPAAVIRAILAATLSASWGVYGPAFELVDVRPRQAGSEEYLDSEKYQVRHWNLNASHSLAPLLKRLNEIRRTYPAFHSDRTLEFLPASDPAVVAHRKSGGGRTLVTVVSVDPHGVRETELELPFVDGTRPYQVHDLLSDERYLWTGQRQRLRLDPASMPARVFVIREEHRSESDFEYWT